MSQSDKGISVNLTSQDNDNNQKDENKPQVVQDQKQEVDLLQEDFKQTSASAQKLSSQAEEKIMIYKEKLLFLKNAIDRLESHASNCNNQANQLQEVLDQQKNFVEDEEDFEQEEKVISAEEEEEEEQQFLASPKYFEGLMKLQRVQAQIDGVKAQQERLLQQGEDVKEHIETALEISKDNDKEGDEQYKISVKLQEMNAKHQATKSKLRHHQQCLDQLSRLLVTTRNLLNAYPLKVKRAQDFDILFEKKVFLSDRTLQLQKVLLQLGYIVNTGNLLEENQEKVLKLQEKSSLQEIMQKLFQNNNNNTTKWFNSYKKVSQQLKALDMIREGHLNDQKKKSGKIKGVRALDLSPDESEEISVGSRPQRLAGYNSMQILTGPVVLQQEQQEGKANEEENVLKLSEVAGGYSDEELALGVDIDNQEEDGPYIQITDFFTSLTTVKYILDCSDACDDILLMREERKLEGEKDNQVKGGEKGDLENKQTSIKESQNVADNATMTNDINSIKRAPDDLMIIKKD